MLGSFCEIMHSASSKRILEWFDVWETLGGIAFAKPDHGVMLELPGEKQHPKTMTTDP